MDRQKAAKTLGLQGEIEKEDVIDTYEESFFSIRDYFLKNTVIPQLFVSRLEKLRIFHEAYSVLMGKQFYWDKPFVPELPSPSGAKSLFHHEPDSLESLLREYERKMSETRTLLAQARDIPSVVEKTMQLIKVQQAYHVLFLPFAESCLKEHDLDEDVRVGQQVDSGFLLRLFQKRSESPENEKQFQEALKTEFLRIKKMVSLLA